MSTKHIQKSIELLQELVDTNNPLLYNIIESQTTYSSTEIIAKKHSENFLKLVESFSQKSTTEQCLKLFEHIGVDPLNFIGITNKRFKIDLSDRPFEDIEYFLNFANTKLNGEDIKFPFDFIEKISHNNAFKLLSVWSSEEKKNLDNFGLLWIKEHEYLRNKLLESSDLVDNNKTSNLDLLKKLTPEDYFYRINYYYFRDYEIKNISDMAFYADVQELHNQLSQISNKQSKRVKI